MHLSVILVLTVSTAALTPHTAAANQEIGQAVAAPWSGWWWPLLDSRNPNLYDPEQALQAYDTYVVQTRGENPGTQQWEYDHQRTTDRAATWWGYCHAWAAAAVLEQEPRPLTKAGMTFTLNQVKGMLTITYDNLIVTQWGRRYDPGAPQAYYEDIAPRVFDELIRYYVGQLQQALIFDRNPGPAVSNFPVFSYERTATEVGASTEVTMTVRYARPIEGVMGAQWAAKTYSYTLTPDTDGQWTGPSVDDHPDFVWLPVRRAPHLNPITYEIVREILDTADNYAPSPTTLTPSDVTSESGVPQVFIATYTDANGRQDLHDVRLLINASARNSNAILAFYDVNSNTLYLRNDANTAWLGGFVPGSNNTIENSRGILNVAHTAVSGDDTTLIVQWSITPKVVFTGTKNLYLYASDQARLEFPYSQIGTWNILSPSGANAVASDQLRMRSETPLPSAVVTETSDDSSPSLMRDSVQWRNGTRWELEVHTQRNYRRGQPDWQRETYQFEVMAEPSTHAQPYYVVAFRDADAPAEASDDEAARGGPEILLTLNYAFQDNRLRLVWGMRGLHDAQAVQASEMSLIVGDRALAFDIPRQPFTGGQPVQFFSRLFGRTITARRHALPSGGYVLWYPGLPWYVYMETEGLQAELTTVHP
jgi:Transglutaminase elicitor